MEFVMQDKLRLIEFFEFLLDEEISKPLGQMNSEAVDNYIEILLDLQDKHIELNQEYIDEQVRKIFHPEETAAPEAEKTTKKYFNKKKVWLIAACIAILVALFSIVSFSSERSVIDVLEDFFGTFEFIPSGEEVSIGDESYKKEGLGKKYTTIDDFIEHEKINLLYPYDKTHDIKHISIGEVNGVQTIGINFDNEDFYIKISLNTQISQETLDICNKKTTINNIDYYLCVMEDVNQVQAYFNHNNNLYLIVHKDENKLIKILNNLEEIQYEN